MTATAEAQLAEEAIQSAEFQEDPPRRELPEAHEADALLLNIDGYEGPIDVLLDMARHQKVDITKISILQLVRQYLSFIERAKALNLELAADYLVMAAWLAYLKSRLLLPREENETERSAEDMAAALQFQLQRLESMRNAAEALRRQPTLGQTVFPRGMPEGLKTQTNTQWQVGLYDLLRAYGDIELRKKHSSYDLPQFTLMSAEDALLRMGRMLGQLPRTGINSVWATLESFIPEGIKNRLYGRSALASTFTAGLELAKQGKIEIRQDGLFRPVYLRALGDSRGETTK
jgi:segregation and condensation protein A